MPMLFSCKHSSKGFNASLVGSDINFKLSDTPRKMPSLSELLLSFSTHGS